MTNPYRWQHDRPAAPIARNGLVDLVDAHIRGGLAVELVGGRGMGKSVLLQQIRERFVQDPQTRVVLVPGPPEEPTQAACVVDLARRLALPPLDRVSVDAVMEALTPAGVERVVLLIDEADQYVLLDAGQLARGWFNRLEAARKTWQDRLSVVVAGGLGLLHLGHVLGSGLLSRAEKVVLAPFDLVELRELAVPLTQRRGDVDEAVIETLAVFSGGNPALSTFGLQRLWDDPATPPIEVLQGAFGAFSSSYPGFLRAIQDGVSHTGLVTGPGRVLEVVRNTAGSVSRAALRDACAGDDPPVDVVQALELLQAAGLVAVRGSLQADPVQVHPIASIVNLPVASTVGGDVWARFVADVEAVLVQIHRFGREFHGRSGLLEEQVFSAVLAVGLKLVGWRDPQREPVQAAGFVDLKVLTEAGADGHAIVETKIWPRNDYRDIQAQLDAYRVGDTRLALAVTLGDRAEAGWAEAYEAECLAGRTFERLGPNPDLVGRWRVTEPGPVDGAPQITEHRLVRVPKRS